MAATTTFILTCSLVLSGCGTPAPRKPADVGETAQKAIQKIDHICALPPAERNAQLKKLEAEAGVVLVCSE